MAQAAGIARPSARRYTRTRSAALKLPEPATWEDFAAIPDGERWHELLAGDLVERAMPSGEHGGAQGDLCAVLGPFSRRPGGRAPGGWWFAVGVEIRLDLYNVVRPDLAGWRRERCPERPRGFPVTLRPDWVCEVLSPSHARRDRVDKVEIYHRFQVPHYWILDPQAETLEVHRWVPDGWLLVLAARRGQTVRAEPFDALPLQVGRLFGEDPEEEAPPGQDLG